MKISTKELKEIIPKLSWSQEELARNLSLIGHETEILNSDKLDVTITSNRKDCLDINYLAFDLVALYEELGSNKHLIQCKPNRKIKASLKQINKILGSNVSKNDYKKIERLGFTVNEDNVIVPNFRVDIFGVADIAEEVFRSVGSKALTIKPLKKMPAKVSAEYESLKNLRTALSNLGLSETRTISFSRRGKLKLKNPFSVQTPNLRSTLLYGLLETLSKNPYLRKNLFYEIGNVFTPKESTKLAIVISGYKKLDKLIPSIEKMLGLNISFEKVEQKYLEEFSVRQPNVVFAELEIGNLQIPNSPKSKPIDMQDYKKISKYPPLTRDLSLTNKSIDKLKESFDNLLICELIDTYTNPETKKITDTYRLIFHKLESSFTQEDISKIDKKLSQFI